VDQFEPTISVDMYSLSVNKEVTAKDLLKISALFAQVADRASWTYGGRQRGLPEASRLRVIKASTNAAQRLTPLQRLEMERFAGTLLGTPLQ